MNSQLVRAEIGRHLLYGVEMIHQVHVQTLGEHKILVGLQGHAELLRQLLPVAITHAWLTQSLQLGM